VREPPFSLPMLIVRQKETDYSLNRKSVVRKELHGNPVNATKDQDWNRGSSLRKSTLMVNAPSSLLACRSDPNWGTRSDQIRKRLKKECEYGTMMLLKLTL
jgi:hypothetical protein